MGLHLMAETELVWWHSEDGWMEMIERHFSYSCRSAIIGSMREARRAGTKQASAATATESGTRRRRSGCSRAGSRRAALSSGATRSPPAPRPMASPVSVNARPRLPKESMICAGGRAQRHAHADLVGALCDGVGEHAVDAQRREQQREQRECAQQRRALRRRRQLPVDDLFHRLDARQRLILVQRPDRLTDRRDDRRRLDRRSNHDAVVQVADLVALLVQRDRPRASLPPARRSRESASPRRRSCTSSPSRPVART